MGTENDGIDEPEIEKEEKITWAHWQEAIPVISLLVFISLLHTLFVNPFLLLFRKESQRYKILKTLRLDALCRELIAGEDFDKFEMDVNGGAKSVQKAE